MIYLIGVSRIQKQQQKTQGLEGWLKCHQAEDLGRSPFTSACSCSNPADPLAQAAHEQDRLALLPREIPAGAAYLQTGGQSGCKSKGLFSLWGQDSTCMTHEPSVDGTGRPPPSCSRSGARSIRSYLAATLAPFLPKAFSDSLASFLRLELALLRGFDPDDKVCCQVILPTPCAHHRGNLFYLFS